MTQPLDAAALDTLFREARSFSYWLDEPVSDADLHALYALMKMGPTAANSCPARVVFVRSPEGKARLRPCLAEGNIDKSMSAPVVAVIGYDTEFYDQLPKLFPHTDARAWFAGDAAKAEAVASMNTSLQGAYLILAARSLGLDCGPMTGFDAAAMSETFFPGGKVKALLICAIGHGNRAKLHPRGPRLDFDEACSLA